PLNKRSRRVISASKWVRAECEQALGLSAESVVRIGLVLLHRHLLEPFSVHVAVADRSVRTPISARGLSAAQNVEHAEEDRLPWVPGTYAKTEDASDSYTVTQTAMGERNFTLTLTGSNGYSEMESGNTVTGLYTRTKVGTDAYTIFIDGTKAGGSYQQTVTGGEDYTMEDNGNLATGHYTRTIDGSGTYERTSTGAGATMPSDSGTTGYHWEQTGDPLSGVFTLTQTGTDRYDLLEDFFDISNTEAGTSPGHMNIYPFGQTFVD